MIVMKFRRSPDESRIKDKMLYASSKDSLRRALVGIASEIQGTDLDEIAYDNGASVLRTFNALDETLIRK